MIHTKICGIRTLAHAFQAIEAGADWLGFNFYPPSPRYLTPQAAAQIVSRLRQENLPVHLVGVFVNESAYRMQAILDDCGLDLAQCAGAEPPAVIAALGDRSFKVLRLTAQSDPFELLAAYPARPGPPACLVDAAVSGSFGGTGQAADWSLAARLSAQVSLFLAGGLTPANVAAAVRAVHPWGVDVASGVEHSPGEKDPQLMRNFVSAVRFAELSNTQPEKLSNDRNPRL